VERSTKGSAQYQALIFAAVKLLIFLTGEIYLFKYEIKAIIMEGIM
jgi:uncharacterized iron-regulated membrane protein